MLNIVTTEFLSNVHVCMITLVLSFLLKLESPRDATDAGSTTLAKLFDWNAIRSMDFIKSGISISDRFEHSLNAESAIDVNLVK